MMIIILFVENVLSQCRRCSVVLFSEMKIYQIYVIRDERHKKNYGNRLPVVEGVPKYHGPWGFFGEILEMIRTLETKTGLNASNFTPNIALLCHFMKTLFFER